MLIQARPVRNQWRTGFQRPHGYDAAAVFVSANTSVKADVVETDVGAFFEFDFQSSVVDPASVCAPRVPLDSRIKNLPVSAQRSSDVEPPIATPKIPPGFEKPLFSAVAKVQHVVSTNSTTQPTLAIATDVVQSTSKVLRSSPHETSNQSSPIETASVPMESSSLDSDAVQEMPPNIASTSSPDVSNFESESATSVQSDPINEKTLQIPDLKPDPLVIEKSQPVVEKKNKRKKNRKSKDTQLDSITPPLSASSTPPLTPVFEPKTPPSSEMRDKLTSLSDNLDKLSHSLSCIQRECNNSTLDVYEAKEYLNRAIESLSLTSASVAASEAELLLSDNKDFNDPAILLGIKESTKIVMEQIGILEQVALKIGGDRLRIEEGGIDWRKLAADVEKREAANAAALKVAEKKAKRKRKRTSHNAEWVKELEKQLFGAQLEEKMLEQQFNELQERNTKLGIFELCL